jgi:hypothetical protein
MNYRINSIIKNTQILIIKFEYLQGDSNILDSDDTGLRTVTQSYCKWFHSKIIFRIQMVVKIVIWLNLTVASVCTFQVWQSLIPECSTCSEKSIDYKFVAIGSTEQ